MDIFPGLFVVRQIWHHLTSSWPISLCGLNIHLSMPVEVAQLCPDERTLLFQGHQLHISGALPLNHAECQFWLRSLYCSVMFCLQKWNDLATMPGLWVFSHEPYMMWIIGHVYHVLAYVHQYIQLASTAHLVVVCYWTSRIVKYQALPRCHITHESTVKSVCRACMCYINLNLVFLWTIVSSQHSRANMKHWADHDTNSNS